MDFKALMVDVDGTLIPYHYESFPSKKVVSSLQAAQKKLDVCLVTGRAYNAIEPILSSLPGTAYAVTNGGAVVIDIKTKKPIYEEPITYACAKEIVKILRQENIPFFLKSNMYESVHGNGPFKESETFKKAYMIYAFEDYPEEKITKLFLRFSHMTDLTLHKTRHKKPNHFGFNITHARATKLHGIVSVCEKLHIKHEEIIGVGDGYNDFPLLMASGLKVAMGNAIPELKAIADYIAPPVTEDGICDVINKFILKK